MIMLFRDTIDIIPGGQIRESWRVSLYLRPFDTMYRADTRLSAMMHNAIIEWIPAP